MSYLRYLLDYARLWLEEHIRVERWEVNRDLDGRPTAVVRDSERKPVRRAK